MTPQQALQQAIEKVGSQTALASALAASSGKDIRIGHIYYWLKKATEVPANWAPLIERHTGVLCEHLCPSVDWGVLRKQESPKKAEHALSPSSAVAP